MTQAASALQQAMALYRAGRFAEAETLYRAILAGDPADAQANHHLAMLLLENGRGGEAVALFQRALAADPARVETHLMLAETLLAQNRPDPAAIAFRAALKLEPDNMVALDRYADLLAKLGRPEQVLPLRARLAALKPHDLEAQVAHGLALSALERHEDAAAIYAAALAAAPDQSALHVNLGNALTALGRLDEALQSQERAVALAPHSALAWLALGNVQTRREHFEDAIAAYRRVLQIDPAYPQVHANLGLALCRAGLAADAMAAFRVLEGARAPAGPVFQHKIRHDREQQAYRRRMSGPADGARVPGPAVNPANGAAVCEAWRKADPKIAVIDDLLTPAALDSLRRYCLAAPVWSLPYENGYLGAMPDYGFGAPVIAQIAEDLRAAFPGIFRDYPLYYFWAFKYDSRLKGINIHGDDAAVNVNFWITPDSANRDPDSGGLVVWDVAAPADWSFARFNGDKALIHDFLTREGARPVKVPYRANRAVIFDSDLFHETDTIAFEEGYENRRINVTMLFGKRLG